MNEVFSTHAAGCKIYPPEGQNIQISDAVELMNLSQQLLALCTRMSAKIDPAADFLVQRAAARVAAVNRAPRRRQEAPGRAASRSPKPNPASLVERRTSPRAGSPASPRCALGLRATSIVGRRGPATSMPPGRAGKRPCAPKPEDGGLIANGRRCGVPLLLGPARTRRARNNRQIAAAASLTALTDPRRRRSGPAHTCRGERARGGSRGCARAAAGPASRAALPRKESGSGDGQCS